MKLDRRRSKWSCNQMFVKSTVLKSLESNLFAVGLKETRTGVKENQRIDS